MKLKILFILLTYVLTATAQDVKFSKPHGFYSSSFRLSMEKTSGTLPVGASIHYTTDGSIPSKSSRTYSSPISITGNSIIRAAIIAGDTLSSDVATATYLFLNDILKQSDTPSGYPTTWGKYTAISGTAKADYGMDPDMTGNAQLAEKIKEGFKSLPVLSIVTDKDNFFSHVNDSVTGGIYIFTGPPVGDPTGNGWTRPVSAELFGGEQLGIDGLGNGKAHDFSVNCGIKLHGGHGRLAEKNPKHSLRLVFKKEYGAKSLQYPLFGEGEPNKFNQLVLRCHFGNSWQHWQEGNRKQAQYTRDVWARRMQRSLGWTSVNALYVHVFLNGMYWGLYNIAERVDDQFGKDHLGGKKEDIDVIKVEEEGGNHLEAAEGDMDAWNDMVETVRKAYDNTYYNRLQGLAPDGSADASQEALLDIDAFIDYMLINQYGGNNDWDHHNWYAIRRKGANSQGFRFLCWDSELIIENPTQNVLNVNNGSSYPTGIFHNLLNNKDFSTRYLKRAKELLAPEGMLGQKNAEALWDSLYNHISLAIYDEAARWGDYRRDVHPYSSRGTLYTVDDTYMTERNRLHTQFFPVRSANVLSMIRSKVNIDENDLFEPQEGWEPLASSMFHTWNGSGADAKLASSQYSIDWNMRINANGGTTIAGYPNVDEFTFADLTKYDKLVLRGSGNGLRILANRLTPHGSWKQIVVSFKDTDPYWDYSLEAIVLPLKNLSTMADTDGYPRTEDFVHLHALKVDWSSNLTVSSAWLIPSSISEGIDDTICDYTPTSGFHDNKFRNLQGQVVVPTTSGIYIRNGKIIILKGSHVGH